METIYLSLSAQEAVSTFFVKSPESKLLAIYVYSPGPPVMFMFASGQAKFVIIAHLQTS